MNLSFGTLKGPCTVCPNTSSDGLNPRDSCLVSWMAKSVKGSPSKPAFASFGTVLLEHWLQGLMPSFEFILWLRVGYTMGHTPGLQHLLKGFRKKTNPSVGLHYFCKRSWVQFPDFLWSADPAQLIRCWAWTTWRGREEQRTHTPTPPGLGKTPTLRFEGRDTASHQWWYSEQQQDLVCDIA